MTLLYDLFLTKYIHRLQMCIDAYICPCIQAEHDNALEFLQQLPLGIIAQLDCRHELGVHLVEGDKNMQ